MSEQDDLVFTDEDLKWAKKFDPIYAEMIVEYSSEGKTEKEIADILGVDRRTIQRWKAKFDNLSRTIKAAKKLANDRVKLSLYQRATGYDYFEEKGFIHPKTGEFMVENIHRHAPPDVHAALTWLRFRDPENWNAISQDDTKSKEIKIVISEDDEQL